MAKGIFSPTAPTDQQLALGEFKLYKNYELADELQVGSSRGGLKLTLERSIKEIAFDGAYGAVKGKRRYETFVVKAVFNGLSLKYSNVDIISDMESDGLWESKAWLAASGGVYAAETTIVAQDEQSAKATLTASGDGIHEVFAASKDLTAFANGEASDTADFIGFNIYISTQDLTDLGSSDLRITFHNDAEGTETNGYYYDVAASALTADKWTAFKVLKSAFTQLGGGTWTGVTGVSMKLDAAPSAEVVCYIDHITLIQDRSDSFIVDKQGWTYTDEGDYRKFLPTLTINDEDYYENIAIVGQKHAGTSLIFILNNVYNDGAINLSFAEKDEVVNETEFTAHYSTSSPTVVPLKIRDYQS